MVSMTEQIDAHCHLWALERGDYHWLDPEDPKFTPIARNFGINDLKYHLNRHNIKRAILVQAAASLDETHYLLSIAANHPEIAGVVGWVDLSKPDAPQKIKNLAQNPKLKAIRPMLENIPATNWILTAPTQGALRELKANNIAFDALIQPRHLDTIYKFSIANPDLPMVIDHWAKPDLSLPPSHEAWLSWKKGMQRLAKETSLHCKVSGLLTEMAESQLDNAEKVLQPLFDQILDWFGPNRVMWGSDWPVVNLARNYARWREVTKRLLAPYTQATQQQILCHTARRFYRLEDTCP